MPVLARKVNLSARILNALKSFLSAPNPATSVNVTADSGAMKNDGSSIGDFEKAFYPFNKTTFVNDWQFGVSCFWKSHCSSIYTRAVNKIGNRERIEMKKAFLTGQIWVYILESIRTVIRITFPLLFQDRSLVERSAA